MRDLSRTFLIASSLTASLLGGCAGMRSARSAADWVEVRTEDVLLKTDLSESSARRVATRMQSTHDVFSNLWFGCAFEGGRDRPIEVTLLENSAAFHATVGRAVGGVFATIDLLGEDVSRIVVTDEDREFAARIFQHELTHVLVARCVPRAPTWLDEGMASFLETAIVEDGTVVVGVPPYVFVDRTYGGSFAANGIPIVGVPREDRIAPRSLVAIPAADFYGDLDVAYGPEADARLARYASASALVRAFELDADSAHEAFASFVAELASGSDTAASLERLLGQVDLDALVAAEPSPSTVIDLAFEPPPPGRIDVRAMTVAEAHLELALLGSGRNRVESVIEHSLAAILDPSVRGRAHLILADEASVQGDLEESRAWIDRGLALDPDDPDLLRARIYDFVRRRASADDAARDALRDDVRRLGLVARSASAFATIAEAHLVLGEDAAAFAQSERALTLDPDSFHALAVNALANARRARYGEALVAIERAIARSGHRTSGTYLTRIRDEIRARAAGRTR